MKKLFISMLGLVCSLSLMATQTAYVQIDIVGTTYPAYSTNSLYLTEDSERNASYESGYDSQDMGTLSNDYSVLIYGFVGSTKCSSVATDDLTGLEIGFTTNNVDTEYKLQFFDFDGQEFILYDRLLHTSTVINASTPDYPFTAAAGRVEVNNRFVIGVPAPSTSYTVTPNANGWATFSAAEATVIPTGATVYRGVIAGEELQLHEIEDYVPANTGVIVSGSSALEFEIATVTVPELSVTNDLKATSTYNTSMENVFVLKGDAFLEYVGTGALALNKAFIQLPQSGAGAPSRIRMVINGTQDVENVQGDNVQCTKVIENGQIYILHNGKKYNVQGQIVK